MWIVKRTVLQSKLRVKLIIICALDIVVILFVSKCFLIQAVKSLFQDNNIGTNNKLWARLNIIIMKNYADQIIVLNTL